MILVENAAGFRDVDCVRAERRPGQPDQPVQIGADHAVFGRGLGHALEPLELSCRLLLGFFRHPGLLDATAHFGDLGRFIVAFAQLLLDVPKLLAQDVLALLGGKRLLGLLADLFGELEHLDALREQAEHLVEALLDIERLQHLLFFICVGIHDPGNEIGKRGSRGQAGDGCHHFRRHVFEQLDSLAGAASDQADPRLDLRRHHLGYSDFLDIRRQERKARQELDDAKTPHALRNGMMAAVRGGDVTQDLRRGADLMQLRRLRILDRRVGLQHDPEHALAADRFLGGGNGRLASDRQRQNHPGKKDGPSHRQDDHAAGRKRRVTVTPPGLLLCHALCLIRHRACRSLSMLVGQGEVKATIGQN